MIRPCQLRKYIWRAASFLIYNFLHFHLMYIGWCVNWINEYFFVLFISLSSFSLYLSLSLCIWLYLWLSAPLSKYTQYNFFIWCIKIMGWKLNLIIDELNIVLTLVLHINLFHIDKLLVIYLILVLVFRMALLLLHSDLWKVPQCRIRCDFFKKSVKYASATLMIFYFWHICVLQIALSNYC